jgi:hypothetical protein
VFEHEKWNQSELETQQSPEVRESLLFIVLNTMDTGSFGYFLVSFVHNKCRPLKVEKQQSIDRLAIK